MRKSQRGRRRRSPKQTVEDVDPQLGQSPDGGLLEGAHQGHLEDSRGKERRSGGPGSQKIRK